MPTSSNKTVGRRYAKTILGVAVLGSLLFSGASAVGAAAPAGGAVQVFVTPHDDGTGPIVITGAIGDSGQTLNIDKNGKTDPNGDYVKITLKKGTFEVNAVTLNAITSKLQPRVNAATCSGSGTGSGPVTLFNGTGLYKGVAGTVHITETFAFIGPLYADGAKKGQCNMSESAQPIAEYSSIIGSGTVHFS